MSDNKKDPGRDKPRTTITYYGKKVYSVNPLIVRKKPVDSHGAEYRYEDMDEKEYESQNWLKRYANLVSKYGH